MSDADPDPTRVEHTSVFAPDASDGGVHGPPGGALPPEAPPPDRRPWIIVGLLVVIVGLLVAVLLLSNDDGDDDTTTSDTTTSEAATSTTEDSTTTSSTTSTTTSTTAPAVTVPPAQCASAGANPMAPGAAVQALHDAWVRGDQACAAELANPDALAELFERDGAGAEHQFQGCTPVEEPDPHTDCAYTYPGGATHYKLVFSPTDGWRAFDITQVAD